MKSQESTIMDEPKKGSMFCGGCCDMRRAVIIVNTIGAALGLIAFGYCSYICIAVQSFNNNNDDDFQEVHDFVLTMYILIGIVIAAFLVGIWGAYSYNILGVGFSALFIIACFITYTVMTVRYILGGALIALVLYPHVGLGDCWN